MFNNKSFDEIEEYIKTHTVGIDDSFQFGCQICGDCCKNRHEPIILAGYDLYRIAKHYNKTPEEIANKYCAFNIGGNSHLPVLTIKEREYDGTCSFSRRGRCELHQSKSKLNALTTTLTDSVICSPVRVGSIGSGGQGSRIYSVYGKTVALMANGGGRGVKVGLYKIDLPDGDYTIRKLTPIEAERCQTLPDNYTALGIDDTGKAVNISNTQRYKCVGNGWTVDVIAHILNYMTF